MAMNRSSVFLEVIENLSKSPNIGEGNVSAMAKEILYNASNFLKINRANAWLMDNDEKRLECIFAYDRRMDSFYKEADLLSSNLPIYFNHIRRSDIIISFDARTEPFNKELVDSYLIPLGVYSMMEVPILSAGKLKGIICFEQTDEIRKWTNDEQHFALALTQLLTLTLETNSKNRYREELEQLVNEKSVLIAEINHRVKNNLAVITALIRAESNRAKDPYHKELFNNLLSKSFSLSTLQNSMYRSKNYDKANFSEFVRTLLYNMTDTYGHNKDVKVLSDLGSVDLNIDIAIPCSLIINELITNSFKYAFREGAENVLEIHLSHTGNDHCKMVIKDNGPGLPPDFRTRGTGFELVDGLIEQIDAKLTIDSNSEGTAYTVVL